METGSVQRATARDRIEVAWIITLRVILVLLLIYLAIIIGGI